KTVEDRLQNGQTLTEVRLLEYNAAAGLNQVACLFSRPGPIALGCEGILVLMTADCKVVGLIDPFDLVQPNPYLPPLQKAGELPFAVARPSAVDGLAFSQEEMAPVEMRRRAFFDQLRGDGNGAMP